METDVRRLEECVPTKDDSLRVSVRECSRYRTAVNMTDWSTLPDDCTALISSHYRAKVHHRMMMCELSDTIQYMRRNHWSAHDVPKSSRFLFIVCCGDLNDRLKEERRRNEARERALRHVLEQFPDDGSFCRGLEISAAVTRYMDEWDSNGRV